MSESWSELVLGRLKEIARRRKITHAEIAKRAGTSRTRVTAILNDDIEHVSSDLLIRILASLGYRVKISVDAALGAGEPLLDVGRAFRDPCKSAGPVSYWIVMPDTNPPPRQYHGVMISSTFTDLEQHRAALVKALKGQELTDVAMENDTAKPDVDVIDSSLRMVRDASAYILLISYKYGQTPECPTRNPGKLSITELEFNEAQRLGRPVLLFIMGDKHPLRVADVEIDSDKREKLNAFRERAKQMKPGSPVHRVYATFDSLEEFKEKAIHAGLLRGTALHRFPQIRRPPAEGWGWGRAWSAREGEWHRGNG